MRVLSIDVGAHSIKFCESEVRKKSLDVVNLFKAPIKDPAKGIEFQPDEISSLVSQSLKAKNIRYDRLVLGISSSLCSFRFTQLPFTSRKRIDDVLPLEMEDLVPFSSDEMIIDYQIINQEKKISELLAVMVPSVHYDNYISAFSESNVESDVVMPDAVGLSIFLEHYLPESESTEVAIDIGYRHSTMAFIRDRKMVYLRSIPFGYTSFSKHIQNKTDYSPDDVHNLISQYDEMSPEDQRQYEPILDDALTQLVVEANQTLVAYRAKSKEQIGDIFISGGFGAFSYVIPTLSGEFPHPVQTINIFSDLIQSSVPVNLHEYAVTIGYASRYQSDDPQEYVNFRRKETKAHKIIEGIKKYLERPQVQRLWKAIFVLLVVFIPYLIVKSVVVNIHYEKSTKEVDRLVKKVLGANFSKKRREAFIKDPQKLVKYLDRDLKASQAQVSIFEEDHVLFTDLLHRITQQLSSRSAVDVDVFEFSQESVRIVFQTIKGNIQPLISNIKNLSMVAELSQKDLGNNRTEVLIQLKVK